MVRFLFCAFLLIACSAGNVFGQAARSPFSAFGIGDYYGNAAAHSQGMAGLGVSNAQYLWVNNINPALLVFNGMNGITTFQAGIMGEQRTIRSADGKDVSKGANLNYLLLGFPIKSGRWVTSVGLNPYTTMRYRYTYSEPVVGGTDEIIFREEGSGGINQVAWSHGVALHKYLSVGAKASYFYSAIENNFTNTVVLSDQTQIFTPTVLQRFYYRGVGFTGGVSLHIDSLFNGNYKFNLGAVYDFKTDLRTEYMQTLSRTSGGVDVNSDTLTTRNGITSIPSALSLGLSFGKGNQWLFGVDARMTDYTTFGFFENQQAPTTKGMKVAAGFELTPNPTSFTSYLKVVTYRTGVSFEEYPYLVNGNPLRDLGINFGLSLPVASGCRVDLSGRWGKRGNIETNTIEENYFKIYFGVTFNDRWFIKRRFD